MSQGKKDNSLNQHTATQKAANPFGGRRLIIRAGDVKLSGQLFHTKEGEDRGVDALKNMGGDGVGYGMYRENVTMKSDAKDEAYRGPTAAKSDKTAMPEKEFITVRQNMTNENKLDRNNKSQESKYRNTQKTGERSAEDLVQNMPEDNCAASVKDKNGNRPNPPRSSFTRTCKTQAVVQGNGNESRAHVHDPTMSDGVHKHQSISNSLKLGHDKTRLGSIQMQCESNEAIDTDDNNMMRRRDDIDGRLLLGRNADEDGVENDSSRTNTQRNVAITEAFTNSIRNQLLEQTKKIYNGHKNEPEKLFKDLVKRIEVNKPFKVNVNTNAHGDQTIQPTIITHTKPTHGSQKFLVRKDKQWNNGDGCEPSYIIHIESRTDQSSVSSRPQIETRRRRGDIVRMKRLEIAAVASPTASNTLDSEEEISESSQRKMTGKRSSLCDGRQRSTDGPQQSTCSGPDRSKDQETIIDKRRPHSDKKEQGDPRSRGNQKLRLIDHLERTETSPNNIDFTEVTNSRNENRMSSKNTMAKIPVVFKDSVTWIPQQFSPFSLTEDKTMFTAADYNQRNSSPHNKVERNWFNYELEREDNVCENSCMDNNQNLNINPTQTCTLNMFQKERNRKSPKFPRVSHSKQENDRVEGREYTLNYVTIPLEVMSSAHHIKYEDLLAFVKVRTVRDAACQYSPPPADDELGDEVPQLSKSYRAQCPRNEQPDHKTKTASACERPQEDVVENSSIGQRSDANNENISKSSESDSFARISQNDYNKHPSSNSSSGNSRSRNRMARSLTSNQCYNKRKKRHACKTRDCKSSSEQCKVACESLENSPLLDIERYTLDSPLPSWSNKNFNPNANFSSCEISPYPRPANEIRIQVLPTASRSMSSLSDHDAVGMTNPRLNENYSNQRSFYSSEGEQNEEEEIVLEPMTPSMLQAPPAKDEPSPRYSAHMSLGKLQKLIEEAKANSRASVKILDQNTNYDGDCCSQEREAQEVSNTFIGEYLYKLWRNECLCDVKVTVDEVDFFVHKLVLAAFSNVFCPSTPQPPPSVCFKVPCSTPDAVNQIFNYIYTSSMELKDELLDPILSAAIFMGISEVTEVINEILMKPTLENLELYINVKRRHGKYVSLADFPKLYQNYFVELTTHESFLNLSINEFEQLLRDPDVLVTSELDTIGGIANWVKYNAVDRANSLARLLRCVSFESISPKTLASISEEYSYLFTIPGAPQVISEAFKFHALKLETQCGSLLPLTSPCKPIRKLTKVSSKVKKDRPHKTICYSPTTSPPECETFKDYSQRLTIPPSDQVLTDFGIRKTSTQNLNSSASQHRESNCNSSRFDVHPSNYFRNLPREAAKNPGVHHVKLNTPRTPSQAASSTSRRSLSSRGNDVLRQQPAMVWHSKRNGERELWKCSEISQEEINQLNKARHPRGTPTRRPGSKLRKKRPSRYRHHHGYNNNADDIGLILSLDETDQNLTQSLKEFCNDSDCPQYSNQGCSGVNIDGWHVDNHCTQVYNHRNEKGIERSEFSLDKSHDSNIEVAASLYQTRSPTATHPSVALRHV